MKRAFDRPPKNTDESGICLNSRTARCECVALLVFPNFLRLRNVAAVIMRLNCAAGLQTSFGACCYAPRKLQYEIARLKCAANQKLNIINRPDMPPHNIPRKRERGLDYRKRQTKHRCRQRRKSK